MTFLLPAVLVVLVAGLSVLLGGEQGAGIVAIGGVFLVAFASLLFRRAAMRRGPFGAAPRAPESDAHFLWFVFLAGALLRVALALTLRFTGFNNVIAPDEYTFHDHGTWFAMWLEGEAPTPFAYRFQEHSQVGYFAVVGVLYGVFGPIQIVPVLVNCIVGALCARPAFAIAARMGGRPAARTAALLVTFFPSLVLWSSLLVREAFVLFAILWSARLAQSLLQRFRPATLLGLFACLAGLATLRAYVFLVLVGAILLAYLMAAIRSPARALATGLVCGAGILMLVKGAGLAQDFLAEASLQNLALRRQYNALGGPGGIGLEGHDLSTPMGALTYLPIGLSYFLLAPFPWESGGRQMFALPEVLVWYVCIPFVVTGTIYALRHRRRAALVPLLMALLLTILYALVEGNVGIIFRHRAQGLGTPLRCAAGARARRRARPRRAAAAIARDAAARRSPGAVVRVGVPART